MTYSAADLGDYAVMLCLCVLVAASCYGWGSGPTWACGLLALGLGVCFVWRHGAVGWRLWPEALCRDPGDALGVLWDRGAAALRHGPFVGTLVLCATEQMVIAQTPHWPHGGALAAGLLNALFWGGFGAVTAVRLGFFGAHVASRDALFTFLAASPWRKSLGRAAGPGAGWSRAVHLCHALATGVLCHLLALGPLYVMLQRVRFSLLLAPLRVAADGLLLRWWMGGDFNAWLYRDHWVCHHSTWAFVYLHGPHHDAIPVSFMAAHDTGMLEGFLRFAWGVPDTYMSPLVAVPMFSVSVVADMVFHQYVPGIVPYSKAVARSGFHHAEHHFLSLWPLG